MATKKRVLYDILQDKRVQDLLRMASEIAMKWAGQEELDDKEFEELKKTIERDLRPNDFKSNSKQQDFNF